MSIEQQGVLFSSSASNLICKRCDLGVDDDGDGNCAICANMEIGMVVRIRKAVARRLLLERIKH